ncbi:hypothetical protein BU25DRAFT_454789 [Macroventuria anomochaeta]|uniref:Uncharacterized protein n=1 Tax=Macroventuria anomochaeta TaxID=301207 RepID=A0ACB6SE94_9PLEO|nr:uncharacterized protein BU25DRAFT_454789 [Macroventuria anomochaeta]KAF2632471.1 hypothetical protein BU25DRAFT_454789 [Macroventuria anomochaeta]
MATVTIGRAYFDALLRRAQFHTSGHEFELAPDLFSNVTISKEEHDYLQQCCRDYTLLKSALFRGGLTMDTLNTLLAGESEAANDDTSQYEYSSEKTFVKPRTVPVTMRAPHGNDSPPTPDDTEIGSDRLDLPQRRPLHRAYSNDQTESCVDNYSEVDEEDHRQERAYRERIPVHDQRTILITNLADRTTHKDIADVIRGGRLLDIFLRNDRSATVSFVEGAADFLAYVKRNDIYLHAKRLEFRWADRQFHVPHHISNKIAGGASRNLIVSGVAGRVTEEQIRDQLDHIHNLVVVDIHFLNGDAYISTNSIHNALFARTCMMSRTIYKGTRIDWAPDECAAPLPQPSMRTRLPVMRVPSIPLSMTNTYALLDTGSDIDSDAQTESYISNGIRLDRNDWAKAAVA